MKFTKGELLKKGNKPFDFDEEVTFSQDTHFAVSGLRGLKNVRVRGSAQYYNDQERLFVKFVVEGIMIVPCALTNVDVDYSFSEQDEVVFCFSKNDKEIIDEADNIIEVKRDVADLMPIVFETIICSIPLKVVAKDAREKMITKGNGWKLTTDADKENEKEEFDPRLLKLRELLETEEK